MIICLGTTPAIGRAMIFERMEINGVNRAAKVIDAAAGKSVNVAKVVSTLGEEVIATGFVGGDRGAFLCAELDRAGIGHDFVTVGPRTRLCVTLIDQSAHTHTELIEESSAVEAEAWESLEAKLGELLGRAKLLALSGSLTPGAPVDFYRRCAQMAAEAGVPTIVDAQGPALATALPARPLLVKPNGRNSPRRSA